MKMIKIAIITILSIIVGPCNSFTLPGKSGAFLPKQRQKSIHDRKTILFASSDKNNGSAADNRRARTCVRNFLTQRSVQSFMWLLNTMRDPHTNVWLENFMGSKNLLQYNGSAGLNLKRFPDWDIFFRELMEKPADVVIVEIRATRPGNGLSKNNPYRKIEVSELMPQLMLLPNSLAFIYFFAKTPPSVLTCGVLSICFVKYRQ